MLEFSVKPLLCSKPAAHVVLDLEERKRLSAAVASRGSDAKHFAAEAGFTYDTLRPWITLASKNRNPSLSEYLRLCRFLGLDPQPPRLLRFNNSAYDLRLLPTKVCVDSEVALALGLFAAEGWKRSLKKVAFTNTSQVVVEFFLNVLLNHFGARKNELTLYVYAPDARTARSAVFGSASLSSLAVRAYAYKNSRLPCFILSWNSCVGRYLFEESLVLLEQNLWREPKLAAALLSGLLAGDGCVSFSPERHYYEVSLALAPIEMRLAVKALDLLDISYRVRPFRNVANLLKLNIHRKSNFERLLNAGGFAFSEEKNIKLREAIAAYTFSR